MQSAQRITLHLVVYVSYGKEVSYVYLRSTCSGGQGRAVLGRQRSRRRGRCAEARGPRSTPPSLRHNKAAASSRTPPSGQEENQGNKTQNETKSNRENTPLLQYRLVVTFVSDINESILWQQNRLPYQYFHSHEFLGARNLISLYNIFSSKEYSQCVSLFCSAV